LPRVRARLDEESAPRRGWFANRLVLASAAVLVVAFFAVRPVWRPDTGQRSVESVGKISAPPQVTRSRQNREAVVASPVEKNRVSQQQFTIAKNTPVHETQVKGNTLPEVLVPRDQEVLFAKYAEQWSLRKRAPILLARNSDPTVLEPLQVPPIQIAELDVKPLAEEISQ
jgi:hypothetical protein